MGAENEGKVKEFVEFSYVGGQPRANRKASQKKGENNEKKQETIRQASAYLFWTNERDSHAIMRRRREPTSTSAQK
ncbi:MAG TPA: hypothetical protein PKM32_08780 [Planctomycetota bacterium]|jgi:hypothetical protein|nr:hypothetical protein [Planctomycetota bacterium]